MSVIENDNHIRVERPTKGVNIIKPFNLFHPLVDEEKHKSAVVFANQAIILPLEKFELVWKQSRLRICADGGANRLLAYLKLNGCERKFLPDVIIGDLDSLLDDTMQFYRSAGVMIKLQSSQYYTDLGKSLSFCNLWFNYVYLDLNTLDDYDEVSTLEEEKLFQRDSRFLHKLDVTIVGAIGGRFDQTIHGINQLYTSAKNRPNLSIKLLNKEYEEVVFLVNAGKNFVQLCRDELLFSAAQCKNYIVGLLPLGHKSVISTSGLKWDVEEWSTEIAENVSSSNMTVGDLGFWITTDEDLVINLSLNPTNQ